MGKPDFSDEFKRDAVAQITDVALHMAIWRRKPKQRVLDPFGSGLAVHCWLT
ncbi:hypothetical protein [Novosphingobium sp.]|jgi:hypothetical protein|uniref:hypothetical protein n=1 Tax=Novosphingobium sp. TaxID=1874826 RepID=UPI002FDF5146